MTLRPRSEKQLEYERFLFWCIPWNWWMIVPAAVLIQLCLGSLYAWSVYNVPIETVCTFFFLQRDFAGLLLVNSSSCRKSRGRDERSYLQPGFARTGFLYC